MRSPVLTTTIRVGKKAQVVIPRAIRDALDIEEGDTLSATVVDGRVVLLPVLSDPRERLRAAGRGLFTDIDPVEFQREARQERRGSLS